MKFLWNGNGDVMTARHVWKIPESEKSAPVLSEQLKEGEKELTKLDAISGTKMELKQELETQKLKTIGVKNIVRAERLKESDPHERKKVCQKNRQEQREDRVEKNLQRQMQPILDRYEQLVAEAAKEELEGVDWKNKTLADQFRIMTRFEEQSKKSLFEKAVTYDETNLKIGMTVGIIAGLSNDSPVEIPWLKNKDGNQRAFHNGWAKLANGAFWGVLAGGVFANPAVMSVAKSILEGAGSVGKVAAGEVIHAINDPMSAVDSVVDSFKEGSLDPALNFAETGRSKSENAHKALERSLNPLTLRKHFDYAPPVDDVLDQIETFQKNAVKYPKYAESEYAQNELMGMAPGAAKVVARLAKDTFTPEQIRTFQIAVQHADKVAPGDVEKLLSTAATNGIMGFFASQSPEVQREFRERVLDEFRGGNPGGDLSGQKMVLGSPEELQKLAETYEKSGIQGILSDGLAVNALKIFGMTYVLMNVLFGGKNLLASGWDAMKDPEKRKKTWKTVTFPLKPFRMIRDGIKKKKLTKEMMESVLKDGDSGIVGKRNYNKFWKTLDKADKKTILKNLDKATRTEGKLDWKSVDTLTDKIEKFLKEPVSTES